VLYCAEFGPDTLGRIHKNLYSMHDQTAVTHYLANSADYKAFLQKAIRIASALAQLHRDNIVHQNVRPQNVLVHAQTGAVELSGRAATSPASAPPGLNIPLDALPYIAPEQTGRINRPVDQRADLYALGITFYEMLTGAPPFHADDLLGWVHCHIARAPRPLTQARPDAPVVLSDIVAKLLAKLPEERYQSAHGLQFDLEKCLSDLEARGRIAPFPLGERDVWGALRIPAKLYGRDTERERIFSAFERVVATGAPELLLVTGYSGIGKSALVQELHKPVAREQGFFLAGKFEQYKRDIPYYTLGQAFHGLIRQVLTESEVRLEVIRRRLQEALGPNAQLIVELIPQVELIIGKQPPVVALPANEAQQRFNTTLRQFIGVFATREHPLVLFLDDLQWADFASLEFLRLALTQAETRHLLIVGAYRDNEVGPSHPLIGTLKVIEKEGGRVSSVVLGPLALEHLNQLFADTFHTSVERTSALAKLVSMKTGGNPFFATQLLSSLFQEGLIRFDVEASAWRWDVADIQARGITENVAELLVSKIERLPGPTQEAVKLAASVGNEINAEVLALIVGEAPSSVLEKLLPAVQEGLLVRRGDVYTFAHDRVQQAAYMLIPEERRGEVHLRTGRLLIAHSSAEEIEGSLFDIVNQLNRGSALISDAKEVRFLAELNLRAGKKAKASAAYRSAAAYLSLGEARLTDKSWDTDYPLARDIHIELAECEYLDGDFDKTERLCELLLSHARTNLDAASAYRLMMNLATARVDNKRSIALGLECLKRLGIDLAPEPSDEDVLAEMQAIRESLKGRKLEELLDLPMVTDPEMVSAMSTLAAIFPAALYTSTNLADMLVCRIVSTSIAHGNTASSAFAYVAFGMSICTKFCAYSEGYGFGKLGYELSTRPAFTAVKAEVCNLFGATIMIWTVHVRETLEYFRVGLQASIESGNLVFGCSNAQQLLMALLIKGERLESLFEASMAAKDFILKTNYLYMSGVITAVQRLVQNMRGLTMHFSSFDDEGFAHEAFEEQMRQNNVPLMRFWHQVIVLQARFLSGDYDIAMKASEAAKELLWSCPAHILVPEYHYYSALTIMELFGNDASHREALSAHAEKLRGWAESCPANFLGKYQLVTAEIARIEGRTEDAAKLYDQSIRSCRASGFIQNEGLSNELAARFYIGREFLTIPGAYLREARSCYSQWGALGKVRQLEMLYPELLERASSKPPRAPDADIGQLDVMTAVKASQALSSELGPDQLLAALIRIVIEHSGAQRCCLILPREEDMSIAVEATVGEQSVDVQICDPGVMPSPEILPLSLIQYVRRTRELVILDDATSQGAFVTDEYIVHQRPRSVLSVPVVRRSKLVGILYLENNLVSGAFAPRQLAVLQFLAAVSLENTALHAELAQESAERRQAEQTLRESEERLRRLVETANVIPWEADVESGRITYVGPQAVKMFGYPESEWHKAGFWDAHLHPDDREEVTRLLIETGARDDQVDFECRLIAADGRTAWLHNVSSAGRRPDGKRALGGFLFDITDRKETEAALRDKLDIIQRQQDAIRRLSSPIIEVWDGVLTMPIFGTANDDRAQQMMEVLLEAVVRTRCRYAIIDLTGAEALDTGTADHIIKIIRAVQLLGAQGIVVGIRPEMAQTMVAIGVDLSGIVTLANLREALLMCMRGQNATTRRK